MRVLRKKIERKKVIAKKIFDERLRPSLKTEILYGRDCIVVRKQEPTKDEMGEIVAVPIDRFVELFAEPLSSGLSSFEQLLAYSKEKGLGWESTLRLIFQKSIDSKEML